MGDVHVQTLNRAQNLQEHGYTLIKIWECEYEHQISADVVMENFIANLHFVEKLDPREAFFGGRTEAAKLYFTAGQLFIDKLC